MAVTIVAGLFFFIEEMVLSFHQIVPGSRSVIYLIFGAASPGFFLYRWGRGPRVNTSTAPLTTRKAPLASTDPRHVLVLDKAPGNSVLMTGKIKE